MNLNFKNAEKYWTLKSFHLTFSSPSPIFSTSTNGTTIYPVTLAKILGEISLDPSIFLTIPFYIYF